jgi:hypothetical protein
MPVEFANVNCPSCPNWHRVRITDDQTRWCPVSGKPYLYLEIEWR